MDENSNLNELECELDRLLVAAVLNDISADERERLNDMLAKDINLRQRASRFLEEESVLCQQFRVLNGVGNFHSLPTASDAIQTQSVSLPSTSSLKPHRRFTQLLLLASLAFVAVAIFLSSNQSWVGESAELKSDNIASDDIAWIPQQSLETRPAFLQGLVALPPVLSVSWAGPQFAPGLTDRADANQLHEGVISFKSALDLPAEGYMIKLQQGAVMEIVITAEADAENALAVIEFDDRGRPTGRRVSFSNHSVESGVAISTDQKTSSIRFGSLGVFRERNDSVRARYFLLTCVHKLVNQFADDSWHVSRMSVQLEDANFVHVGWDDSGMMAAGGSATQPDEDFNDLSAVVRIDRSSDSESGHEGQLLVLSDDSQSADSDQAPTNFASEEGVAFTVAAEEIAVLKLSNRARTPITLAVVDQATGQVLWHCLHVKPRFTNVGICSLINQSSDDRKLRLICKHLPGKADSAKDWLTSDYEVLLQQDAFTTIGFGKELNDGNKEHVKVDMIWMKELL